jgi:DNA-binding CsgD family transcriptional regulator
MELENARFVGVVEAIYETVEHPLAWREACAKIAALTGARAVSITAHEKKQARISFIDVFRTGIGAVGFASAENKPLNHRIDPVESFALAEWRQNQVNPDGNDIKADYVSRRNILDTAELLVGLTCEFETAEAALSPHAAHWLDRLAPHLARAARLQDPRFLIAVDRAADLQFIDEWRQPAMLVAMDGALLRANRAARRLLRHTALVQVRDGMLVLADNQHRRVLADCLGSATRDTRADSSRHHMLRMSASSSEDALYIFYHLVASDRASAALLTFYHPDSPSVVDPDLLSTAFDLTPAECRVAHSISEGRTPKEIAARLGVQHDTVRKQLQAIYQKTATNRQADLIRLLLHLPAHRAPQGHVPD